MIAVDTNLLVYAHRSGAPEHRRARGAIEAAASTGCGWGIALTSVGEFWSVVTHPLIARGRQAASRAAAFLRSLVADAEMRVWTPGPGFEERLLARAIELSVSGARIFDLQIALTALEHGAKEVWTHDAAFVKLAGIAVRDPFA